MTTAPTVSAIVAVWGHVGGLVDCVRQLEAQLDGRDELIIVTGVSLPDDLKIFSNCRVVEGEASLLIPELWGIGIQNATKDLVAITTSHFLPNQDWLHEIREAHRQFDTPAIGGFIAPPNKAAGSMSNWATYFLRYSQYLSYLSTSAVDELAGDNAAYKRDKILEGDLVNGFWELDYHRQLLRQGEELIFVPTIGVVQNAGFGFWSFIRQRYQHGVKFGLVRRQGWGVVSRWMHILASPLIPLILLSKVLVRVLRSRRFLSAFFYSLPALFCFVLAWALGETVGYIWPTSRLPQ